MAQTAAVEDYAKAIYALQVRGPGPVTTNDLAERVGVTAGSASAMLRRLDELGLTVHVPYRGVELTDQGRRLALEVLRRHRLLESFLAQELDLPWDRVHDEAEILGHPTVDPHGDPIPSPELEFEEPDSESLESLQPGDRGRFVRVSDSDPEMLRYLSSRGIAPGLGFVVVDRQPFGGPLFVSFDGAEHAIGGELARAMRVTREEASPG